MFIAVKIATYYLPVSILNTVIEVLIGGIVYILMLTILKHEFILNIYNQLTVKILVKK